MSGANQREQRSDRPLPTREQAHAELDRLLDQAQANRQHGGFEIRGSLFDGQLRKLEALTRSAIG